MNEPTIGAIVYYNAYRDMLFNGDKTYFAAMITDVQHINGTVSLSIFTDNGIFFRFAIPKGDEPGHWNYMPTLLNN